MINVFLALLTHATLIHPYECLLLRLSEIRIFPKVAIYTKNATLDRALVLQMLFQGNREPAEGQRMIKRYDLAHPPFGRDPTTFILITSSQVERVQKIKERRNQSTQPSNHALI
jgi:hypothetical protein